MSLAAGTRIGQYEVKGSLGVGGMGEVYRAHDTTLLRDVALKVLPDAVVRDSDRMARFKREALLLASMNHPNIAAIYGFEESTQGQVLILELVEGPTLAERLDGGPIALEEALPLAIQVTEALEAAHEQGIVHRDLKPANIKLRPDGTVKVLDFGLAKALDPNASTVSADNSRMVTSPTVTLAGVILGTAAYMSPEQAKGRPVDRRSDVWAFGAVLYEMLTGQRAFRGDDVADTLAAVLRGEPVWATLPADTPPSVVRLLWRCLQKDPRRRLQHIGDARLELTDLDSTAPRASVAPARRRIWPLAVAAAAGASAVGLAVSVFTQPPVAGPLVRFSISAPELLSRASGSGSSIALSPDGRTLVYAVGGTRPGLERRQLSELSAEAVRGTEGGTRPFFSPDGEWIGFFADGKLKKVPVAGGQPLIISDASPNALGTWGDDGTIVVARPALSRVASSGGTLEEILGTGDGQFYQPELLPGSQAVLVQTRRPPNPGYIEVIDLQTRARHQLLEGSSPKLAATGDLLFVRQGRIWATKFDTARLAVVGTAVPVVESVGSVGGDFAEAMFTTSGDGTLVYVSGTSSGTPVWLDRSGQATPAFDDDRLELRQPRLSPDGTRVVANNITPADLWIFDLARGNRLRLTTDGYNRGNVWSPDNQRIAFFAAPQARESNDVIQDLFVLPSAGGPPTRLLERQGPQWAVSWSPDGRYLVFEDGPGFSRDLWVLPIGEEPRPLVATRFNERGGVVSPDGRSLAFVTDESGRAEVYVQPFPDPGPKMPISTNGGLQPMWSRDGRELFYREDDSLMAVAVQHQPFRASAPRKLFDLPGALYNLDPYSADYDVAPDGRFLTVRRGTSTELRVVLNWVEELRRAVAR
jgi:serine/threonine protein kinase/Tol biopolymer transport system component